MALLAPQLGTRMLKRQRVSTRPHALEGRPLQAQGKSAFYSPIADFDRSFSGLAAIHLEALRKLLAS